MAAATPFMGQAGGRRAEVGRDTAELSHSPAHHLRRLRGLQLASDASNGRKHEALKSSIVRWNDAWDPTVEFYRRRGPIVAPVYVQISS
jgi:hypothetical protein